MAEGRFTNPVIASLAGRSNIPGAGERVSRITGSKNVEMKYLDLSKIETIHRFVQSLVKEIISLDICILNAATALPGLRLTASGLDELFLVNYLSNVILSQLLLKNKVIKVQES